ncbi:hypothetical protein FVF75_10190 [Maritimibacter fusiformis]|uniref:Uncharacterized protein n=2 Tax=Maritimibacter fusiformis TaxID=2603819 RepID=A0A5D0RL07_9RHOB|nr:hypothetical protein FVF75_10190 [Maritimibacter fusiformis]
MMNPRHFFRMAKWARRPPSSKQVKLVLGIIVVALVIFGLERLFGTPDWMILNDMPRGGRINR